MRRPDDEREADAYPADDEIEIIEVVGLDEESSGSPEDGSAPDPRARDDDLLLDLDADDGPAAAIGDAATHQERLLRLTADFDNFRKRIEREREAAERHAAANLVNRLLPVLDNFERALSSGNHSNDSFHQGVALIFRQLLDELRREGLSAVDSVGEPFDPELHEAVATTHQPGLPPHTIVEEVLRGYLLHDRLLRPALVTVNIDPNDPGRGGEGPA